MPIPEHYIPDSLSPEDQAKQRRLIKQSRRDYRSKKPTYRIRDKLKSHKHKKSGHVSDFKRRYPHIKNMADLEGISKEFKIPVKDLQRILEKGQGAYFSSGSRPNQTPHSWANARLASSLLGRRACRVDRHILKEHGITCQQLRDKYQPGDTQLDKYYDNKSPEQRKRERRIRDSRKKKVSRKRQGAHSKKRVSKVSQKHSASQCTASAKPYKIVPANVEISYFKNARDPIKTIKDAVKHYHKGQLDKVYGGSFGIASLKAMGLIPRANGKYHITSHYKPYCRNYQQYKAQQN